MEVKFETLLKRVNNGFGLIKKIREFIGDDSSFDIGRYERAFRWFHDSLKDAAEEVKEKPTSAKGLEEFLSKVSDDIERMLGELNSELERLMKKSTLPLNTAIELNSLFKQILPFSKKRLNQIISATVKIKQIQITNEEIKLIVNNVINRLLNYLLYTVPKSYEKVAKLFTPKTMPCDKVKDVYNLIYRIGKLQPTSVPESQMYETMQNILIEVKQTLKC